MKNTKEWAETMANLEQDKIARDRLIVAAPDLLEACQALINWDDSKPLSYVEYANIKSLVQRAIAKAEGR